MDSVQRLIEERGTTHGDFIENGRVSQDLKITYRNTEGWGRLLPDQKEALDLIATKIARILSGKPDFKDHWDDIAGYAAKVASRL